LEKEIMLFEGPLEYWIGTYCKGRNWDERQLDNLGLEDFAVE
jgi:hypothetical protein